MIRSLCMLVLAIAAFSIDAFSTAAVAQTVSSRQTIRFASTDQMELHLDFYPSTLKSTSAKDSTPVIVWVHGGAWRRGTRSNVPIKPLTDHGFAIASVDYRLSEVASFPAQTQDIKAAIRYLRIHASELKVNPDQLVIAGASAGGHLAALVGVSPDVAEIDDQSLGNAAASNHVAAIVSFYGASNLNSILSQSTPHGLSVREPALKLLLGDLPNKVPELARLASPVTHVDSTDPPLLLIHGDQDPQMPINQSHELEGVYKDCGLDVTFEVVHGAAHGGAQFYTADRLSRVARWIQERL